MLNDLFVGTGLGITASMSFLFAHAVLPSLVATNDVAAGLRGARLVFYVIFAGALGLACFVLVRAFTQGVGFLDTFYPRYGY